MAKSTGKKEGGLPGTRYKRVIPRTGVRKKRKQKKNKKGGKLNPTGGKKLSRGPAFSGTETHPAADWNYGKTGGGKKKTLFAFKHKQNPGRESGFLTKTERTKIIYLRKRKKKRATGGAAWKENTQYKWGGGGKNGLTKEKTRLHLKKGSPT